MPPTRSKRATRHSSAPYDMGNLNNWYSEQFRAKLAEWNIVAPINYTKAELKSLNVANLGARSDPSQNTQKDSAVPTPQDLPPANARIQAGNELLPNVQPVTSPQSNVIGNSAVPTLTEPQGTIQSNVMVNIMNTMTSLMQKILDKDNKDNSSRKTLDNFSAGNTTQSISASNISYGLHPEQIKDNDYVSESLREKIVNGKYVNMVLLLIPEFEQTKDRKDRYRDARLNRSLSIEEFIVAFEKYKRIHCSSHPWRKEELDTYESNLIEIARVYGRKFYEYHKIFSQKCAVALEQGKKVNWAEKDKDLLQMIIGGTQCNTCNICQEVTHVTQFCPQTFSQLGTYKFQYPQSFSTPVANSTDNQRKTVLCSWFNAQGCKKDKCNYFHACSLCNSVTHGKKQCSAQPILNLGKSAHSKTQLGKRN